MSAQLQACRLGCERDDRWLFRDLSLTLAPGDLCRIEGPNGSGKTSLIKLLTGQLPPDEGEVRWLGQPLPAARPVLERSLLYVGHLAGVKGALTPLENLAWYQALHTTPDAGAEAARWHALAEVGLAGFEDVPVQQLSAGQQRRAGLARLHVVDRPLWILDEPFTAIDRAGVDVLEQLVHLRCQNGGTVIVITHHAFSAIPLTHHVRLDGRGGHDVL
ncbi:cytochrome c biogenesis heme-transporting ATPase CcmA [Larsenimonas rhizosphaerae]|uniref:Cytochrome c biogenesis heme-transporting ATPase CcmA n=1 Tax=Larsenimonas rhizosphaerae TaxID=2944682 RepID=A0AA42CWJ2_9GAMM|nr:cytochrome c biogenesis heme-transporting ATPase CcmA [Larsenimonas rhizosphaerae]MCM2129999.1 cytochrome c biogenesis heme-transporting ATPase CcmA [Larsenimonas rhizosphaerae]MCX2522698.1 cytochrome c biogenesis heme-transporting ATPase CcmA [Larsenimonas rhizosphaerae]